MWKKLIFAVAFSLFSITIRAGTNDPIVSKAWIGESIPGQTTATLQMNLTTIKQAYLTSVSSPIADSIEIHSLFYCGQVHL